MNISEVENREVKNSLTQMKNEKALGIDEYTLKILDKDTRKRDNGELL